MNNRNPIAIKKRQDRESERRLGRLQKRYTIQATNREEQVATDSMEWGAFPGVSGERLNGIQEVRGSIPLISTREKYLQKSKCFFFVCFLQKGEKGIEGAAVTTVRWTALKVKVCFVGYRFALWGNCLLCVNYHCFFIKSRCLFSSPEIPETRAFLSFHTKNRLAGNSSDRAVLFLFG